MLPAENTALTGFSCLPINLQIDTKISNNYNKKVRDFAQITERYKDFV